ncbi:MAG: right-handed parallel beta-helix repeat-containing protein [Candidatus Daviesbacteria bacterium]|nr:right-handed parallel beta-helix repeat-containing protein [Candidatus Daviesbacteria bacterium]
MTFDYHPQFAIGTVKTVPSPAASGTTLVLKSGQGTRFPDPATYTAYNATIFPNGVYPNPANAEIVRITAKSTDTLTITRTQESSSARTVQIGDIIVASITRKTFTDIEDKLTGTSGWDADIIPATDSLYDLGSTSKRWAEIWGYDLTLTDDLVVGDDVTVTGDYLSTSGNLTLTNGTISAEQLTSTDDANITDDLTVGGDITSYGLKLVKPFFTVGMVEPVDYLCDGTADNVQLQAALTAANAAGGGKVYVKEGTYDIAVMLEQGANVALVGSGWGTILTTSVVLDAFVHNLGGLTTTNQNTSIENIQFDGNSKSESGIWWESVWDSKVRKCYLHDMGGVVGVSAAIIFAGHQNIIEENLIKDTIGILSGIWYTNSASHDNKILNNTIINAYRGIMSDDFPYNNLVQGNSIEDSRNHGILIVGDTSVRVIGNQVSDGAASGIFFGNAENIVVANNTVSGNAHYGIYAADNPTDPGTNYGTIIGNTSKNNGQTIGYGSGIQVYKSNQLVIVGNHCYDDQTPKTQAYGLRETSTSDYNTIIGNNFSGNLTEAMIILGVHDEVVNNLGADVTEENELVYMQNTSGGALVAGNVVTLKAVAAGNQITTTTTQGDDLVYGMLVENIASTEYGYVQILGKTTLLKVNGTVDIAIGDFLGTYTTAGIAMKADATTGDMAFAIALEAYTTNDSNGVIDALIIKPRRIKNDDVNLKDTNASNNLHLIWNENDTADRVLNLLVAGASRSLTLNEDFTIGDGYSGTLTFTGSGKTLSVEDTSVVNQDLTTDATPTFAGTIISTGGALKTGITAGNTLLLQAYDTNLTGYVTFATLTANDTPTMDLATAVTIGTNYIYRAGGTDIPLLDGGTNASLTASNGGIVYSTSTALAILSGTATANQVLLSGLSTTPAWSTATYPATTTINQLLYSGTANVISGLTTAASGLLVTSAGGVPSIATDIPTAVTIGTKYVYRADGTDVPVSDGGTGVSTLLDGGLLVGATTGAVEVLAVGLTTQVLVGGGAGTNPGWSTDLPTALTIGTKYIYRADGTDVPVADGGTGASTFAAGELLQGNTATAITSSGVTPGQLSTIPVDLKLSTASKGGVFNSGFELGTKDTAVTASGIIGVNSGWYLSEDAGQMSAELDTAVAVGGSASLKLEAIDTSGGGVVYNTSGVTLPILALEAIPLKVSTVYKLTLRAKTNLVGASGVWADVIQYDSAAVVGTTVSTSKLSTTNDWTVLTVTFTSDNDAVYGRIGLQNSVAGTVNQAWFDNITLEEVVSDTTFTGKVAEKIRPVLQAVTSSDNIDQSLDTGGAYADTYALTNAVNEGATHIQTFTPTKKYTTQIGIWPVASGTAVDWTLVVHTAGNVVLASKTIAAASIATGSMMYFDVPNIWSAGALHFHLYASATTGTPTCKANTSNDLETASFIQRYAKKCETYSIVANGIKTELKADKDGLLSNSILDLDNGKYQYAADFKTTGDIIYKNDIFAASVGDNGISANPTAVNGWVYTVNTLGAVAVASDRYLTWKVNTLLPVKHLQLKYRLYYTGNCLQISSDNINWTTLHIATADGYIDPMMGTDLVNGLSTFYLRFFKAAATNKGTNIAYLTINADLDTSKAPTGLFYPLVVNQFTETVKLPAVATRVYFQSAKYTNEYGIVVPVLEFTDGSAVLIGYVPLKIDNTQEANPCVSILSTTTNYQQSGTGSNVTNGYVLNTGEYMTFTSTVAEIKVDYQVGTGTTAIAAITKNTIYYSSNGEGNDSTQDPSHQFNAIVGVRQQGSLQRVQDMGYEVESVRQGIAETQQLVRNSGLTLGFDTGTTDDYAITLPYFTGYVIGLTVIFRANTANTTDATLNINGLGAKAIVKGVSTALSSNDILALMYCQCVYDGTNFVLLNPRAL